MLLRWPREGSLPSQSPPAAGERQLASRLADPWFVAYHGLGGGGCVASPAPPPPSSPTAAAVAEGGGCVGVYGVVLGGGVVAEKPAAPVACETVAPVAREPVAPVAREPVAPVARESVARLPLLLAAEPVTPVARVPVAPVARVPVAPVAHVPVAPVALLFCFAYSADYTPLWLWGAFLTCAISNALNDSADNLAMAHRRSELAAEVNIDDEVAADGYCSNNCPDPESDEEENLL
ncbi:unnamed protein product [Closterium sp. NIES-53]